MLLRVIQPILAICDELGNIVGIRILRLTLDVDGQPTLKNGKNVEQDLLFTDYKTLNIKQIVQKHIHTVSMIDLRRDVIIRKRLFDTTSTVTIIRGATRLPVQTVDGAVQHKCLVAVIGTLKGNMQGVQALYDYNGNQITPEQLCENIGGVDIRWAKALYGEDCCMLFNLYWINNPKYVERQEYQHISTHFRCYSLQAARQYIARNELLNADVKATLELGEHGAVFVHGAVTQNEVVAAPEAVPSVRVTSIADGYSYPYDDIIRWQLLGHAQLRYMEITADCMPIITKLQQLYSYNVVVRVSDTPLVLPQMAASPCGTGSNFILRIVKPLITEDTIDFSKAIYDCSSFDVRLGGQLTRRAIIPQAHFVSYTSWVQTESFALIMQKAQHKHACVKPKGIYTCTVGLGLDAEVTKHVLLDFSVAAYNTTICLRPTNHEKVTQANVLIRLNKKTEMLYLQEQAAMQVSVQGADVIESMEYIPFETGCTHVYSRVKRLIVYAMYKGENSMDDVISHLYLHAGVEKIVIVYIKNAIVTQQATFVPSAINEASYAALKVHVPKGNKIKMFTEADWEYLNTTPNSPALLQSLQLSNSHPATVTHRAHTQVRWVVNNNEIVPLITEDL